MNDPMTSFLLASSIRPTLAVMAISVFATLRDAVVQARKECSRRGVHRR